MSSPPGSERRNTFIYLYIHIQRDGRSHVVSTPPGSERRNTFIYLYIHIQRDGRSHVVSSPPGSERRNTFIYLYTYNYFLQGSRLKYLVVYNFFTHSSIKTLRLRCHVLRIFSCLQLFTPFYIMATFLVS